MNNMKNLLLNITVNRVLTGVSRRAKSPLTVRQTTLFSDLVKSLRDEPLVRVTQYLDHLVGNGIVQKTEGLLGELPLSYWERDYRDSGNGSVSTDAPSNNRDTDTTVKTLPAGSTIQSFHGDSHAVLMPVDPDTGLPVDYMEGQCGTFKIVQESGPHIRAQYESIFSKKS